MRLLDRLRTAHRANSELGELRSLFARLTQYAGRAEETRNRLCTSAVVRGLGMPADPAPPIADPTWQLSQKLLLYEGHFSIPQIDLNRSLTTTEIWELTALVKQRLAAFEKPEVAQRIEDVLARLVQSLLFEAPAQLPGDDEGEAQLFVPRYELLPDPAQAVEGALAVILREPGRDSLFPRLWQRLEHNLLTASGIDPQLAEESRKQPIPPTKAHDKSPGQIVQEYLGATPLAEFLETPLPFSLPLGARFEHTHIVGGSGHGKTQLLQSLILRDLEKLAQGRGSIVVIDSQGDMLRTIMQLAELSPSHAESLAERLVLIDPNDIEHPPALNLFDFGLDRLERYTPVEREKLVNGAVALYEYLFGALLGAELTMRQGVIFRYLARLMMNVPGATIHTLLEFVENPEATRPYFANLDRTSRHFFETQFFAPAFKDTRQQILARLWGVLSNSVLERMFANERNKLDLFDAINRGSLILINTAKDLLKQEGCEILGRFFIAMIAHAAQERAAIPADRRRATFVYVDEAQDYFDESLEQLLNQARKYKVGLVLAHQNLGQFEARLQAAVMASTTIKLAGGVSAQDAGTLAKEMRCEREFLQGMRKRSDHTEFACFIRTSPPARCGLPCPSARWRPGPAWPRPSSRTSSRAIERASAPPMWPI